MKILHISDLHFCHDSVRSILSDFQREVKEQFNFDLDIHFADEQALKALHRLVQTHNPAVIAVTGDITTLGDPDSYTDAKGWFDLILRESGRSCLIVPGNHDALGHNLASLRQRIHSLPWYLRTGLGIRFRRVLTILERLAATPSSRQNELGHFHAFLASNGLNSQTLELKLDEWSSVTFYAFNTVSLDPLWMNAGQARIDEWHKLIDAISRTSREGVLRIVLVHHNPMSSPGKVESNLVHAYNSMPGGTEFLSTLQDMGVDLVLHGHQHTFAHYSFDFDLAAAGHAFAVGAPSSTSKAEGGCNILTVKDINHVSLQRFVYSEREGFQPNNTKVQLALERHRPSDLKTATTRFELKRYWSLGGADGNKDAQEPLWRELQTPGSEMVYMSGRHFREIRNRDFYELKAILNSPETKLRILLSDPEKVQALAQSAADLWGVKENLTHLAQAARRTIEGLEQFLDYRSKEDLNRIDVRVSHTLLPFGAYVRDANKAWGKMTLQILPVGVIGTFDPPVLRLNRRYARALYDYYLDHLKMLFLKGSRILGDWSYGDADLRAELPDDFLQDLDLGTQR